MILLFVIKFASALFTQIDYNTVYQMSLMSHNVYCGINDKNWINTTLDKVTNISLTNNDVNAYLFTNMENNIGVIAFKGTSLFWSKLVIQRDEFDGLLLENDLSSSDADKYNDNLFFSCCFYKQSNLFKDCNVCDERSLFKNSSCCKQCYTNSLELELNYINIINKIINNAMELIDFESSLIMFTGHSLGGMLAGVSSMLYDKMAITFETPGDKHYLNLLNKSNSEKIYHYGHNADPIFMGNCGSTCSMMGYNMNTKCHSGYTCLYDAKSKLGYTESILNHRIEYIIKNVIPKWGYGLPECIKDDDCIDCEDWVFN